jgi:hypothetical protein
MDLGEPGVEQSRPSRIEQAMNPSTGPTGADYGRSVVNRLLLLAMIPFELFAQQSLHESDIPVRPGVPFWNQAAVQFQFAPAFAFKEVAGAEFYRFTLSTATGEKIVFEAAEPSASLAPVWKTLPVGRTNLSVESLNLAGVKMGPEETRSFHRAAVFRAGDEVVDPAWGESARIALDALVHSPDLGCWFTSGEIDGQYPLYRYPAKIIGAAASSLAAYAAQEPVPADAREAIEAAKRAADTLLTLCEPAGSAWEFHPPTYHPTLFRQHMSGHMTPENYMTNCGAEAGRYLLDVHEATGSSKYLEAAVRIAETYAKQQREDGSWVLFVNPKSGVAASDNVLVPTLVIQFLDQLEKVSHDHRFDDMRNMAVTWIMQNPVRTWNWQGQFEDVKPLPPYQNLTKHEACDFAIHLLGRSDPTHDERALALDLLRFAEDQFVVWDQPPVSRPGLQNDDGKSAARTKRWMLPCVLEQYRCYAPVSASSAKLIRTYLAAYRVTGDGLHLQKAKALAGTLVRSQRNKRIPGRYLTWLIDTGGPTMWINCELMVVRAMQELAADTSTM